ncbi:MAG: hypothetical protein A07HR67_02410 [uncultured archaeon A07HR67]|jgi:hypothetical protein|nr:MAG: hypothetical protein A07HR67_02410 [uncultured archaeon A07HR67]
MAPPGTDASGVAFSREEAWVAHAALLDACDRAAETGEDVARYRRPLRDIEQGRPLDPPEVALLRDALVEYLGDAPIRDRALGRALLCRTDDAGPSARSA